jgi:hypothetical protein
MDWHKITPKNKIIIAYKNNPTIGQLYIFKNNSNINYINLNLINLINQAEHLKARERSTIR